MIVIHAAVALLIAAGVCHLVIAFGPSVPALLSYLGGDPCDE